jgi:hypothetical protein
MISSCTCVRQCRVVEIDRSPRPSSADAHHRGGEPSIELRSKWTWLPKRRHTQGDYLEMPPGILRLHRFPGGLHSFMRPHPERKSFSSAAAKRSS